jgi:hypothetical protein
VLQLNAALQMISSFRCLLRAQEIDQRSELARHLSCGPMIEREATD